LWLKADHECFPYPPELMDWLGRLWLISPLNLKEVSL
jgi:hypothetical protein